ncbi:hypothetical protein ONZ45_g2221 [Pleurotus djamor]|nr:hypothetical protein ONZ45_g2221 [Pleurotus djamor]
MPEHNECLASFLVAHRWFTTAECSFRLTNMYVDATEKEAKKFKRDSLPRRGLPYPLDATSKVARGPPHSQTKVFPPFKCSLLDSHLTLSGVHFHPRNLILEFLSKCEDEEVRGTWWMQVQLLTHTVVQVYTASEWHDRIAKVAKEERGFRVGMALDFGEYVLAFVTLDLLFKVTYARARSDLDAPVHDIYHDFETTALCIIDWAESRLGADRSGLAIHAIRRASKVFIGIGVYTVVEIFLMAGLLPIYTEEEVFDNPSRTGRFIEAFYSFSSFAHENMLTFLLPYLGPNYFLSLHNEQRLNYKSWLKVYAKDRVWVSLRWMLQYWDLIDWFSASRGRDGGLPRCSTLGFFDVFEPTYLRAGLEKDKNFGPIIFGIDVWTFFGGKVWLNDPLTAYFRRRGLLHSPTFIHPSLPLISSPLFLSPKEMSDSWTTSYPVSSAVSSAQPVATMASKSERANHLFDTIVNFSKEFAIGPTDYCGIARIHRNQIILCHHDPILTDYSKSSFEANFTRRQHLKLGKQKTADPQVAKKRKRESESTKASDMKENKSVESVPTSSTKKRRISADKQVVLQHVQVV